MSQNIKRLVRKIQEYKPGLSYCRALHLLLWTFECSSVNEFLIRFSEKEVFSNFDKYFWRSPK